MISYSNPMSFNSEILRDFIILELQHQRKLKFSTFVVFAFFVSVPAKHSDNKWLPLQGKYKFQSKSNAISLKALQKVFFLMKSYPSPKTTESLLVGLTEVVGFGEGEIVTCSYQILSFPLLLFFYSN